MTVRPLLILMLLAAGIDASAQRTAPGRDTLLKGSTIEVLQSFKPQVKEAPKPEWVPQLPPADTSHPTFSYDVPQQTLFYTYSSLPLRPLALGREAVKLPFANYIKIGGGNLSTLFLDAGIGGIRGKDYETNIHLHHLSQKGAIRYQQSSLSGIEAEGLIHKPKYDWRAVFNGERNQYYYYGYDHSVYPHYDADSMKEKLVQTFLTIRGAVDMKNSGKGKFSYNPGITASSYTATAERNASETSIGLNLPLEYKFDDVIQAHLAVTGNYAHLATTDTDRDNTFAALVPGISIHTGAFTGNLHVGLAMGINSNQYILPNISAAVKIPNSLFTISAGWQSGVRQNTYEQLTTENPYIFNSYNLMQTRRDEYYADVKGGVGDHFSFSGRVSWWSFTDLPVFLNDTGDNKQFKVLYDTVNALSVQLSARYKVADKWSAGITGEFYNFSNGNEPHPWHIPAVRIKADYTVKLLSKLNVTVYLAFLGGIYARDVSSNVKLLSPVADLGGNVEYQIVPRLSAFVQVSNVLNSNYQRWYGYQAYGVNVYGGLRFKF